MDAVNKFQPEPWLGSVEWACVKKDGSAIRWAPFNEIFLHRVILRIPAEATLASNSDFWFITATFGRTN